MFYHSFIDQTIIKHKDPAQTGVHIRGQVKHAQGHRCTKGQICMRGNPNLQSIWGTCPGQDIKRYQRGVRLNNRKILCAPTCMTKYLECLLFVV